MPAAKMGRLRDNGAVALRRTPHAVYDTQYHLVWSPKYRKKILTGDIQRRVNELFKEIAGHYDITIDEMEVSED
ncbi:MAG TPA: IS200/IS605 family transposase, partial [Blastocatellia bacterium]|nr:IS200/IS605 family transposase [Blastocatellia bacterium]